MLLRLGQVRLRKVTKKKRPKSKSHYKIDCAPQGGQVKLDTVRLTITKRLTVSAKLQSGQTRLCAMRSVKVRLSQILLRLGQVIRRKVPQPKSSQLPSMLCQVIQSQIWVSLGQVRLGQVRQSKIPLQTKLIYDYLFQRNSKIPPRDPSPQGGRHLQRPHPHRATSLRGLLSRRRHQVCSYHPVSQILGPLNKFRFHISLIRLIFNSKKKSSSTTLTSLFVPSCFLDYGLL